MKKVLTTLFFLHLFTLVSNAQIYTSVAYYDKFDDVIKKEQRKTLIEKTDSTFIIEEKGKAPVVYYILNLVEEGTRGSKDNVVNLINNVYGYETAWCLIRYDLLDKYNEIYQNLGPDSNIKEVLDKMGHFWIFAVHRTITTQYTGSYLEEYFWLQDEENSNRLGKGVNRIIYERR